jgi:hypothetical protein
MTNGASIAEIPDPSDRRSFEERARAPLVITFRIGENGRKDVWQLRHVPSTANCSATSRGPFTGAMEDKTGLFGYAASASLA